MKCDALRTLPKSDARKSRRKQGKEVRRSLVREEGNKDEASFLIQERSSKVEDDTGSIKER